MSTLMQRVRLEIAALATRLLARGTAAAVLLLLAAPLASRAAVFPLPADGSNLVGQIRVVTADARNTLLDIARHFDLGYEDITAANPDVSVWVPGTGRHIVVPTQFILPPRPWTGIVVNIPQHRLYYFPKPKAKEAASMVIMPLGIARPGWATPLGKTSIIAKFRDPAWFVPKSILAEQRAGDPGFPDYFPPGPGNPMGMLAMETGFSQIFIHGTNRPWGVGMQVSHGCLHLYPEDAAYLFPRVTVGTPVRIMDRPLLLGQRGPTIYLSASKPVSGNPDDPSALANLALEAIIAYSYEHRDPLPAIDWGRLQQSAQTARVMPIPVSADAAGIDRILAATEAENYDFEPYGIDANDADLPGNRAGMAIENQPQPP